MTPLSTYVFNCNLMEVVTELKSEIAALKIELNEVKSKLESETSSAVNHRSLSEEQIIDGCMDRQARAMNIVMYNLPESDLSSADERIQHDRARFLVLVGKYVNETVTVKGCVRIGKHTDSKTRPVKIMLNLSEQVALVLR